MIRFDEGNQRFNYRIVGVVVHNDAVLLHQVKGDAYWALPGGRAELGETAETTLKREMLEELGVDIEIVRLLWLVENFFTCADHRYHEVALYFLMQFPVDSPYLTQPGLFYGLEETPRLIFQWFPRQTELLAALPLQPAFLQTALLSLPETVAHVIQRDV